MDKKTLDIIKEHAKAPVHARYDVLKSTSHSLYVMLTAGLTHYGLYKISWHTGTFERLA